MGSSASPNLSRREMSKPAETDGRRKPAINWVNVNERSRKYVFAGAELTLKNVVRIEVRDSGKHRFECADGAKGFVSAGWLWIELDVDEWTT
jgi:hypothetical protein